MKNHLLGAALCALLLSSCQSDEQRYEKALHSYEALIEAHKPLSDPGYDEVIEKLRKVSADSPAHVKAERLLQAIATARKPLPPRPLAVAGSNSPDELEQKRTECAELAKQLGLAADAGREEARVKLATCREEAERLDAAHAHAEEPGADHAPVNLPDGGVVETLRIECAQWRAQLALPDVDKDRVNKSLQLNADKLKMLDQPAGPCVPQK